MAFPQTVDPTMSVDTTTTFGVLMPPTVNAGDLLIMGCDWNGTQTPTDPTDWTLPTNGSGDAGGNQYGAVYLKVAVGDEGGTTVQITATSDNFAAHAYRVTNWFGTLAGVEVAVRTSLDNEAANPPSLTPSWGNADTLWVVFSAYSEVLGGDTTATAAPSGFGNLNQNVQDTGSGGARAISARRELKTTTLDPGAFTHIDNTSTNAGMVDFTIAIRPGSTGQGGGSGGGGQGGGGGSGHGKGGGGGGSPPGGGPGPGKGNNSGIVSAGRGAAGWSRRRGF